MTPNKKSGLKSLLQRFARDDVAATSVEYALIGVIMAIMMVAALPPIRQQIVNVFVYLAAAIQTAYSA